MLDFCFLNGKIISLNKAAIGLNDLGVLRGYGVFEALKTVNGKIFLFDEHFGRLKNSVGYLSLKLPVNKQEIENIIRKLILKNKIKNGSIRIVLTGGKSEDMIHFDRNNPTFYILVSEIKPLSEEVYKKGVKLKIAKFKRDMAEFKTTNYLRAVKIINECQKKEGFFEILYTKGGDVYECATSNFFAFKNGKLITPKDGVLHGTIRNLVVKLAKKEFVVEEKPIKVKDLSVITEAFITATNKNIVPVVKIDDYIIGNGKVHENTNRIMEILRKFMEKY